MKRRAVFLDRDGVIVKDTKGIYVNRPKDVEILPGVAEGIRKLNDMKFLVLVITNQGGIARGHLTEEILRDIHRKMKEDLSEQGLASINGIYYCPYHPEGTVPPYARESAHRKPWPGMIFDAATEWNVDLSSSYLIGDQESDILCAKYAGIRYSISVESTLSGDVRGWKHWPYATSKNFVEAVSFVEFNEKRMKEHGEIE